MVVEVFRFRVRPDVSEEDFLAADAKVQTDYYYQRSGIVRRLTAKGKDGEWVSVIYWATEEDIVPPDGSFSALIADVRSDVFEALPG